MKPSLNGEQRDCGATTLAELWRKETADLEIAEPRGFAISLNGAVVRRAAWPITAVRDGDTVEIIRAMSGGGRWDRERLAPSYPSHCRHTGRQNDRPNLPPAPSAPASPLHPYPSTVTPPV